MIDTKILPAGEINYNKLNDCYVIFICYFDLFKRGKYCYTFEELVEFLKYVKKTDDTEFKSERMKRLAQRVKHVKESREVEARYMTMLIHDKEIEMDAKEMGRKEGLEAGAVLTYLGMVRKKKDKGCNANTTAEILELELVYVEKVYALLEKYPDYTDQKLAEMIMSEKRK